MDRKRNASAVKVLASPIPGIFYALEGSRTMALIWAGVTLAIAGLAFWRGHLWLWVCLALWWAGSFYDVLMRQLRGRSSLWPAVLAALVAFYGVGWEVTEINLLAPFQRFDKMKPYLVALAQPDLILRSEEREIYSVPIKMPCVGEPKPRVIGHKETITVSSDCAWTGDTLRVEGDTLKPRHRVELWWVNPIGERQRILRGGAPLVLSTDERGHFAAEFTVPKAIPIGFEPGPGEYQVHTLQVHLVRVVGGIRPSEALVEVALKMGETIAIALLATTLAVIVAAPLSFLGARNVMGKSLIGRAVYYVMRAFFNIVRSVEPMIFGIVFVVWVGLGSFAGMLALVAHSVAALGKLFSEVVEHIDPGPVEAVTATGANKFQVIRYAIVPQVVPDFASFALYRWDINVRMSTIIGFVGGGGIGFRLSEWIRLSAYRQIATAVIGIALVIVALDYLSSQIRRRIV